MNLSIADQVWNRAAMESGGNFPGPGDRALASLLLLHGFAMNGGIHHAIEILNPEDLAAAIDGFSYFGFDEMSLWLGSADSDPLLSEWTHDTEGPANDRYAELIPDDATLTTRFAILYRERPSEFAPI